MQSAKKISVIRLKVQSVYFVTSKQNKMSKTKRRRQFERKREKVWTSVQSPVFFYLFRVVLQWEILIGFIKDAITHHEMFFSSETAAAWQRARPSSVLLHLKTLLWDRLVQFSGQGQRVNGRVAEWWHPVEQEKALALISMSNEFASEARGVAGASVPSDTRSHRRNVRGPNDWFSETERER